MYFCFSIIYVLGSDVRENDGIYSGYILSSAFQGNGRYSVKVTVQNLNNRAKILFSQETSETFPYYSGMYLKLIVREDRRGQSRIDNSEKLPTLDTRHRTETNKQKTPQYSA